MKPAQFDYVRAGSVEQACRVVHGRACQKAREGLSKRRDVCSCRRSDARERSFWQVVKRSSGELFRD